MFQIERNTTLARIFHQVALLCPATPHECSLFWLRVPNPICTERYAPDCAVLRHAGRVAPPRGHEPAASSRLASAPHHSPLGRVPGEICGLVSLQGSNAACSLALKSDGVVASRRHSPGYGSSSRLALGFDVSAINRHLSLEATLATRRRRIENETIQRGSTSEIVQWRRCSLAPHH